ncbi:MAG: acrylyl-CoA reductase family protein [Acidimicrobiales bacterium]
MRTAVDATPVSRVLRIVADGALGHGEFAEVPIDTIGSGELLLRASHSSVNYKDALAATGRAKVVRRFPLIGGVDVVGRVVESADPHFRPGDQVVVTGFGLSEDHDGGYAQWVRVPAAWAVRLPEGLTPWESMALGTGGLTAALAIHRLEVNALSPGQGPVAVTGATGGVASLAIAMLARLGYETVALTRQLDAEVYLRSIGADSVEQVPVPESSPKALAGARWAGAVDSVGGETLAWLIRTTQRGGSIAAFGNAGGQELPTSVLPFILRAVNLLGINTGYFDDALRQRLWVRMATDLRPERLDLITRTVGFDELPQAFTALLDGAVRGRLVVEIA